MHKQPNAKGNALWSTHPWAIDKATLTKMMAAATEVPEQPVEEQQTSGIGYTVQDGVAVIPVVGPISKYSDLFQMYFGGVSTVALLDALDGALADKTVTEVLLYIDSPGGAVDGTVDFADAVAKATKPVYAYISDSGNSAAYWIASQADEVWINRAGYAGSIGVYTTVTDYSKAFDQEGIKVHLVKAGDYKGAGEPGTEVTPEVLADVQKEIDGIYNLFVADVAKGRGLSVEQVKALATGQTYIASEALALGLVDAIVPSDQLINTIKGTKGDNTENENKAEDTQPEQEPVESESSEDVAPEQEAAAKTEDLYAKGAADERARFAGILEACKGDQGFAVECFTKGLSTADAKLAYADKAIAHAEALAKQVKQLQASRGAEPVAVAVSSGDVVAHDDDALKRNWNVNHDNCKAKFSSFDAYRAMARYEARLQGRKNK